MQSLDSKPPSTFQNTRHTHLPRDFSQHVLSKCKEIEKMNSGPSSSIVTKAKDWELKEKLSFM
jgi:hypothetical protein